jgi:hypothetical protein
MPYQYKREPLTPDEANRLAAVCETHQERLIVWTLLDTGLRVSELAGLTRDQIDWQNHRLMIYGKGGIYGTKSKRRIIPLTDRIRPLIDGHFAIHDSIGMTPRTIQLSLSRLNHWLPRAQAHPEVVQGTAEFHHQIADPLLPQADPVLHNAAALHTAVDMLNPQSAVVERLVGQVLLQGQLRTAGLLRRHEDLHRRERERQEAQILQQPTPSREWVGGGLRDAQIMDPAAVGVAQKEDDEERIDEQDIFDGVVLFLATITFFLFSRVLGADDAPFGAVMGTRGEADAAAGTATPGADSSASGVTTVAASVSETPKRCASAVRERAGASPRARSAARRAGRRTCIH